MPDVELVRRAALDVRRRVRERDVAGGNHDVQIRGASGVLVQAFDEGIRIAQMFDDIQHQNMIIIADIDRQRLKVDIDLIEVIDVIGVDFVLVQAGDIAALLFQFRADVIAGRTDVQNTGPIAHGIDGEGVRTVEAEFGLVGRLAVVGIGNIVLAVIEDPEILTAGGRCRLEDVPGVLDAVNVTNLVSVIGRNRQLDDAVFGAKELDDDFWNWMMILWNWMMISWNWMMIFWELDDDF